MIHEEKYKFQIKRAVEIRVADKGGDPRDFLIKSYRTAASSGGRLVIEGLVVESKGQELEIGDCSVVL